MQAVLGIAVLLGLAWSMSRERPAIDWRLVGIGLVIQFILLLVFLRVQWVADALLAFNSVVAAIESATQVGTEFVFGYLGGAPSPFAVDDPAGVYLFAFRVLPQVIIISVLIAILWYWRVLPLVVQGMGWALQKFLGVSGALGTAGATSLFLGMVETPMVVRAYLSRMSASEFFTVMTFGMSTVAGSVMILYSSVLADLIPGIIGHILSASVVNIIGAVYLSRIIYPHTAGDQDDYQGADLHYDSFMDALTRGTADGLQVAVNVAAMVLVLVSLVALVNVLIGHFEVDGAPLSLQLIFGWLFAPLAWLIGIPWEDAQVAGSLLGIKVVLNEFIAYIQLAQVGPQLTPESQMILAYALCGFANFGSLGILMGGLLILVPEQREMCLKIAPLSVASGMLVVLITGALVSLVLQI